MNNKLDQTVININGKEYYYDELSENAKASADSLIFVDSQIQQLNNEWAVADTARIGYTAALKAELLSTEADN